MAWVWTLWVPSSLLIDRLIDQSIDWLIVGDEHWTTATYCIDECALIKGLKADTTYRFRVSAVNQFGQSPYSWASIEIRTKKKGNTLWLPASAESINALKFEMASKLSLNNERFTSKDNEPKARFPFKRNRLRCVRCVNENRTCRQTDKTHTHTQAHKLTDADDRYIPATPVGVSKTSFIEVWTTNKAKSGE